jgi:hypothetical protein
MGSAGQQHFPPQLNFASASALIGQLCVVGVANRRTLIKQVRRGSDLGLCNLHSGTEKPIVDVKIEWAATVDNVSRRTAR